MTTTVTEPRRGDPVAADTIAQIIRNTQANRITPGVGYTFTRGPGGTSLTIDRPEPAPAPVLLSPAHYNRSVMAKVLEGSTEEGFSIQCYPNYPHDDGRFNAVAFVPSIAFGTLSLSGEWTGKWVLAHYVGLKAIGGA